jgi:Uma2 family endonuclease
MTVRDELEQRPTEEPVPHYWTLDEYHRAIDAGIFGDRRIELLHGEIVEMPPMNEPRRVGPPILRSRQCP